MAIEKVKAYFREHGMEERIQEFDESSATVELAAQALHCEPQRIAKTLSFMLENEAVLIVAALILMRWKHWWDMQWAVFARLW